MKRLVGCFAVLFLASLVFASTLEVGYNATLVGESYEGDSFAGAEFSAVLSYSEDIHAGDIGVDFLVAFTEPHFRGVNLTVSTPVYWHESHFRVFPNAVLWIPKLTLGYQYRVDDGHRAMLGFSPLTFASAGFVYEFLSPYLTVDAEKNYGWGIRVMKFTAYL